jgi:hypothetical protein
MTKIKNVDNDNTVSSGDRLLGSDEVTGKTKNYTILDIAEFLKANYPMVAGDPYLQDALKADLLSPNFTGIPTVPTAEEGTSTAQAASTKFVQDNKGNIYDGASPTTVDVGGISASSNLTGRTYSSILEEMLVVYLQPSFSLEPPVVTGQNSTVEVGTTLSGTKVFTWVTTQDGNIKPNTIAIYDVTGVSYLAQSLANDGTESIVINTYQFISEGSTQQWKAEGTNTNEELFTSTIRTVTAKYKRYYGASATSPTNSASVKSLASNDFQTSNSNTFTLNTGNVQKKFVVVLPPGRTISEVIDLDALNANITSNYVLTGTINVTDAGGSSRVYTIYEMNIGEPYSANHRHQIKTA